MNIESLNQEWGRKEDLNDSECGEHGCWQAGLCFSLLVNWDFHTLGLTENGSKGENIQCWCQWSEGDWHKQSVPNEVASERWLKCTVALYVSTSCFPWPFSFFFFFNAVCNHCFPFHNQLHSVIIVVLLFSLSLCVPDTGRLYEGCRSILSAESPPFSLTEVFLPSALEAGHLGDFF